MHNSVILYCTTFVYCSKLHLLNLVPGTTLPCTAAYCTALHCTVQLHYTCLHCTKLHLTELHYIHFLLYRPLGRYSLKVMMSMDMLSRLSLQSNFLWRGIETYSQRGSSLNCLKKKEEKNLYIFSFFLKI